MRIVASNFFEGDNGVYYSSELDELFLLEDKKFELFPVKIKPVKLTSFYTYRVSSAHIDRQFNTTVNKNLNLEYIGEL